MAILILFISFNKSTKELCQKYFALALDFDQFPPFKAKKLFLDFRIDLLCHSVHYHKGSRA